MEREAIDYFLRKYGHYFAPEDHNFIFNELKNLPESKMNDICAIEYLNPKTITLISVFGGWWGIDRFMMDDEGMGIFKLITLGCCGVVAIYDWFTVGTRCKKLNLEKLRPFLFAK